MDWLTDLAPHWFWIALGLFLSAAEIIAPGVFLIWLGLAAVITGIVAWALPIGVPLQVVIFALLAMFAVYAGKKYVKDNPIPEADPKMNRRGARLEGEIALVTQAIEAGTGRVKLGDSEWNVRGPDVAAGSRVRVTGADGAVLLVEPM
jgi:hypothetical protein